MVTHDNIRAQMRKGILEYCVLALLRGGPAYGLEITEGLSGQGLLDSDGTLYALLSRLRKQGWVETWWRESASGPPRRYYALSPDGAAALNTFVDLWVPFSQSVTRAISEEQAP